jgi:hypothetical protein
VPTAYGWSYFFKNKALVMFWAPQYGKFETRSEFRKLPIVRRLSKPILKPKEKRK